MKEEGDGERGRGRKEVGRGVERVDEEEDRTWAKEKEDTCEATYDLPLRGLSKSSEHSGYKL